MAKSKYRGHTIESFDGENWFYSETMKRVDENIGIICGHCECESTPEGHDGCLGELKGIMNACCGHGVESGAYVQFLDGFSIHGKDARVVLEILKKYKED